MQVNSGILFTVLIHWEYMTYTRSIVSCGEALQEMFGRAQIYTEQFKESHLLLCFKNIFFHFYIDVLLQVLVSVCNETLLQRVAHFHTMFGFLFIKTFYKACYSSWQISAFLDLLLVCSCCRNYKITPSVLLS